MTAKEFVLSIYPNAILAKSTRESFIFGTEIYYFTVRWFDTTNFMSADSVFCMSRYEEDAWEKTRIYLLKEMERKLAV